MIHQSAGTSCYGIYLALYADVEVEIIHAEKECKYFVIA